MSLAFSSIPDILSSAWSNLLVIICIEFSFDFLSFSFPEFLLFVVLFCFLFLFLLFSEILSLYWIFHPGCWISHQGLGFFTSFYFFTSFTHLHHLPMYLNPLWGLLSFLKIRLLNSLSCINHSSIFGFSYWIIVNFWRSHVALLFPISCISKLQCICLLVLYGSLLCDQPSYGSLIPSTTQREENKPP
jgi:hypothetical protein